MLRADAPRSGRHFPVTRSGHFSCSLTDRMGYELSVIEAPEAGKVEVAVGGHDMDFGRIALQFRNPDGPRIEILGPVRIGAIARNVLDQTANTQSISAVYITAGCKVQVVLADGKTVQPTRKMTEDETGCENVQIASDGRAAGWLVAYGGCWNRTLLPEC